MPLPRWVRDLPNRGLLYEWLVLDNLPRGSRAVARGSRGAPFDLLVRERGVVRAVEVKGNELDERGPILERRRFSASPRQVRWVEGNRASVRFAFLWLDPPNDRFGFRFLAPEAVRWKSPARPKWVLPAPEPIPLRRGLARYRPREEGARLRAAWEALPEADAEDLNALRARAGDSRSPAARTRAKATPSLRGGAARGA